MKRFYTKTEEKKSNSKEFKSCLVTGFLNQKRFIVSYRTRFN